MWMESYGYYKNVEFLSELLQFHIMQIVLRNLYVPLIHIQVPNSCKNN